MNSRGQLSLSHNSLKDSTNHWVNAVREIIHTSTSQLKERASLTVVGLVFLSIGWVLGTIGVYKYLSRYLTVEASIFALSAFHLFVGAVFLISLRQSAKEELPRDQVRSLRVASTRLRHEVESEVKRHLDVRSKVIRNPKPWLVAGFVAGLWFGRD